MAFFRNFAKRPNWLFWALVGLSLFLHLGMLWKFRQIQPLKSDVFIEVTVAAPANPQARRLPKPPANPPQPVPEINEPASDPVQAPQPPEPVAEAPAEPVDMEPDVIPEQVSQWQGPEAFETTDPEPASSGPEPARADEMAAYLTQIRQAIQQNKQYPMSARRRRVEGRVRVSFSVDGRGLVSDLHIVKSSGFSSLDEAGLTAVQAAGPFGAPPKGSRDLPLKLEIPIVFQLRQ